MKKRYTVLALSAILALALAVPALGGPSNPIASVSANVKSIANKALKKAKAAQTAANAAQATASQAGSDANSAQKTANTAQSTATTALKTAQTAQTTANTAKTTADQAKSAAAAAQATADSKMSGEQFVSGETVNGSGASVGCPAGKVPTGGGFVISGAEPNAATVTSSSQYLNGWLVGTAQIKGIGGSPSWTTAATIMCATSP
jgi:membrane protein involved in colicin uptake